MPHAQMNTSRLSIMLLRQILINKYHLASTCDRYDSVHTPLFQLFSPCSSTLKYRPFKPMFVFTRVPVCAHSKDYANQFITSVIQNAPDAKTDTQFLVNISCSGTHPLTRAWWVLESRNQEVHGIKISLDLISITFLLKFFTTSAWA